MLRNSFPLYEDTLICLLQHSFSKPLSLYILISHNLRGKTIMETMADILDRVGTIKSVGHDGGFVFLISYGKLCGNVLYLQQKIPNLMMLRRLLWLRYYSVRARLLQ